MQQYTYTVYSTKEFMYYINRFEPLILSPTEVLFTRFPFISNMPCGCEHTSANTGPVWRPGDPVKATPSHPGRDIYRPDILAHIETTIAALDSELRELSLDIHSRLVRSSSEPQYLISKLTRASRTQVRRTVRVFLSQQRW